MRRFVMQSCARSRAWLASLTLVAVAGCASGGMTNQADTPSGKSSGGSSATARNKPLGKPANKKTVAHVGSTITLGGNTSPGEKLAVTLVKYVPTTMATDQFSKPAPGKRFAAVQFRFRNLGRSAYQDSPSNGAKVIDVKGQSFGSYLVGDVKAGPQFAHGLVNILPRDKALGVIAFEVPKRATIAKVQFGTDSGFGEVGEWRVG
ncbi:MAG TPA: DUF4352 domain-containing protein [Nocardioidaceae bacterium]|jgi:hypothetical protein|nr:DUF4352 domain-containing protein [Nocardioidaceae bacterium]